MKKRLSKTEYIKRFLLGNGSFSSRRCNFCKYYALNYENIDDAAKRFFKEKCKSCIERFFNTPAPYWCKDNFKPLYEWEQIKKE